MKTLSSIVGLLLPIACRAWIPSTTTVSYQKSLSWSTSKRFLLPPSEQSDREDYDEPLVTSRQPHQLRNGRGTFLGFQTVSKKGRLSQSSSALMPDGGLSPCVIRVLGVGGGGCNAVRGSSCYFVVVVVVCACVL